MRHQNLVTSISPRPQVDDSQGDEVPTLSHLNKSTKWRNPSLQSKQPQYVVHQVDDLISKG